MLVNSAGCCLRSGILILIFSVDHVSVGTTTQGGVGDFGTRRSFVDQAGGWCWCVLDRDGHRP